MDNQNNPVQGFVQSIGTNPFVQKVTNFAQTNPVSKFLLGGAFNVAKDIGAGLAVKSTQQQVDEANKRAANMARMTAKRAAEVTDPEEKQRLLTVSRQAMDTISNSGLPAFSEDVAEKPVSRGLKAGIEIGTAGDILSHPVQTVSGILNIARHPIKTIQGILDSGINFLKDPIGTLSNLPWDIENSFKLQTGDNAVTRLGNRVLASQYKGAGKIVANPAEVTGKLADYGLTSPEQVSKAADVITGKDGIIPARINRALPKSGQINLDGFSQSGLGTAGIIDKNLESATSATDSVKNNISKFVNNEIQNALAGKIEGTGDPDKVFQSIQNIGNKAYQYSQSRELADQQIGSALTEIKHELERRLYQGLDMTGNVVTKGLDKALEETPFLPEEINKLSEISPKLAQDAQGLIGAPESRSFQRPFVQGSQMAEANTKAAGGGINLPESVLLAANQPVLALSQTAGGKEAIGTGLRTIGGAMGTATSNLPLDITGQLIANRPEKQQATQQNIEEPHTGIVTPTTSPGQKYQTPSLPQGFLNTNDYNNQINSLTQQIQDTQITNPVLSASLQGQLKQLTNNYNSQQPIRDSWANMSKVNSLGSSAYNLIQKADPSLLNLNGSFDKLLKSADPAYASLGKALQYIQQVTGINISDVKTKEALIAALDQAIQSQTVDYNAKVKEYFGTSEAPTTTQMQQQTPIVQPNTPSSLPSRPTSLPSNMLYQNLPSPNFPNQ